MTKADVYTIVLLVLVVLLQLEMRFNVSTRLAVLERDVQWISATLRKWGLVPPSEEQKK